MNRTYRRILFTLTTLMTCSVTTIVNCSSRRKNNHNQESPWANFNPTENSSSTSSKPSSSTSIGLGILNGTKGENTPLIKTQPKPLLSPTNTPTDAGTNEFSAQQNVIEIPTPDQQLTRTLVIKKMKVVERETVQAKWPLCEGWKKPENFNQYIEHNVETDPITEKSKKSCVITSANTEIQENEIKYANAKNTYTAIKWLYPKKKDRTIEQELLQHCDESVQKAAQETPTKKDLQERISGNAQLKSVHDALFTAHAEKLVKNKCANGEITAPESSTTKDQKLIFNEACAAEKIKTQKDGLFNQYSYQSPESLIYPELRFITVTEQIAAPVHSTVQSGATVQVQASKAEIISCNAMGNNALDEIQKSYLESIVNILNDEDMILHNGKLYDLRQTDIRKMKSEEIEALQALALPELPAEKKVIGILNALKTIREKTKSTKRNFEAQTNTNEVDQKKAFEAYLQGLGNTEHAKKDAARRAFALARSVNITAKSKNYIEKRELLVKQAHEEVKALFNQSTSASWFSLSSWIGSSTPVTSTNPQQPTLPSSCATNTQATK